MGNIQQDAAPKKSRRTTSKKPPEKTSPTWRGFANIRLTEAEKQDARSRTYEEPADILSVIQIFVQDGYKLSITFDADHDTFLVSLTGVTSIEDNQGLTLTSRGPSLAGALGMAWYKYDVITMRGAWAVRDEQTGGDAWG